MCRMIISYIGHEEKYMVPCENVPGVEDLLKDMAKEGAEWPSGPLEFDLWNEEPSMVVKGESMQSLAVEWCDDAAFAKEDAKNKSAAAKRAVEEAEEIAKTAALAPAPETAAAEPSKVPVVRRMKKKAD